MSVTVLQFMATVHCSVGVTFKFCNSVFISALQVMLMDQVKVLQQERRVAVGRRFVCTLGTIHSQVYPIDWPSLRLSVCTFVAPTPIVTVLPTATPSSASRGLRPSTGGPRCSHSSDYNRGGRCHCSSSTLGESSPMMIWSENFTANSEMELEFQVVRHKALGCP